MSDNTADHTTEEETFIQEMLRKWRNRKKKKPVKKEVGLKSELKEPTQLTGEEVYQKALRLFPEEEEQLRHSPRQRSGF